MTTENYTKPAIVKEQIRAARALIGWTRDDLSRESGVPVRTLADLEMGSREPRKATVEKVRATLEAAGVIFIPANLDGEGVRRRRP
jgi:transcriptional regulator with XRE-family HTH domain